MLPVHARTRNAEGRGCIGDNKTACCTWLGIVSSTFPASHFLLWLLIYIKSWLNAFVFFFFTILSFAVSEFVEPYCWPGTWGTIHSLVLIYHNVPLRCTDTKETHAAEGKVYNSLLRLPETGNRWGQRLIIHVYVNTGRTLSKTTKEF